MATHSSILAWETSWIGEPGGLQSMWSKSKTRLSTHSLLQLELIQMMLIIDSPTSPSSLQACCALKLEAWVVSCFHLWPLLPPSAFL